LANEGFEGMANALQILLNEAMKLERSEYLNAKPYLHHVIRRTDEANGLQAADHESNSKRTHLRFQLPKDVAETRPR
jgi:hypothetical protein